MRDGKRLLKAFSQLWKQYRKRLQLCQQEATEEAVHNLRISCRRLLAVLELLQTLSPAPPLSKLRKALKAQLDAFDELRDTQVMLAEIGTASQNLAELADFQQHLARSEQRLLAQVPQILQTVNGKKLQRLQQSARQRLKSALSRDGLELQVLAIIDRLYAEALLRHRDADAAQPASLHRLRIGCKKLRYSVTAAKALLPPLPEHYLPDLKSYATLLGDIQNARVLTEHLQRFYGHQPPPAAELYYRQQQQALLDDFLQQSGGIKRFWRAAPDQPFPWQQAE